MSVYITHDNTTRFEIHGPWRALSIIEGISPGAREQHRNQPRLPFVDRITFHDVNPRKLLLHSHGHSNADPARVNLALPMCHALTELYLYGIPLHIVSDMLSAYAHQLRRVQADVRAFTARPDLIFPHLHFAKLCFHHRAITPNTFTRARFPVLMYVHAKVEFDLEVGHPTPSVDLGLSSLRVDVCRLAVLCYDTFQCLQNIPSARMHMLEFQVMSTFVHDDAREHAFLFRALRPCAQLVWMHMAGPLRPILNDTTMTQMAHAMVKAGHTLVPPVSVKQELCRMQVDMREYVHTYDYFVAKGMHDAMKQQHKHESKTARTFQTTMRARARFK